MLGGLASVIAIITFAYGSLKSHIEKLIDKKLGTSTVEQRVARKISDEMLATADVIDKSRKHQQEIETKISLLNDEHATAAKLSQQIHKNINDTRYKD